MNYVAFYTSSNMYLQVLISQEQTNATVEGSPECQEWRISKYFSSDIDPRKM